MQVRHHLRNFSYYYLLMQETSDKQKYEAIEVMKKCGMYKFFCAIIWIETKFLGLDEERWIVHTNEKAGLFVLNEMLKGGNFGNCFKTNNRNVFVIYLDQMIYRLKYTIQFPSETLSRPLALVCDYINKRLF